MGPLVGRAAMSTNYDFYDEDSLPRHSVRSTWRSGAATAEHQVQTDPLCFESSSTQTTELATTEVSPLCAALNAYKCLNYALRLCLAGVWYCDSCASTVQVYVSEKQRQARVGFNFLGVYV